MGCSDDKSMIFLKWKDKRDVVILRTFHKGKGDMKVERRKKEVNIPKPIDAYNKNMRGVNKCDQMLTAYPTKLKRTKARYKKIFCHLINICRHMFWVEIWSFAVKRGSH